MSYRFELGGEGDAAPHSPTSNGDSQGRVGAGRSTPPAGRRERGERGQRQLLSDGDGAASAGGREEDRRRGRRQGSGRHAPEVARDSLDYPADRRGREGGRGGKLDMGSVDYPPPAAAAAKSRTGGHQYDRPSQRGGGGDDQRARSQPREARHPPPVQQHMSSSVGVQHPRHWEENGGGGRSAGGAHHVLSATAAARGRAEAEAESLRLQLAKQEGRAEGRVEGRAEGRAEAKIGESKHASSRQQHPPSSSLALARQQGSHEPAGPPMLFYQVGASPS